jgi:hypothetical protein
MKTRSKIPLRPPLDNELTSYVAAAKGTANDNRSLVSSAAIGAITLGSLSLAPALHAEIVYTPANQTVGGRLGSSVLHIDLNNDGVADIGVSAYNHISFGSGDRVVHSLGAFGLESNQILARRPSLYVAADVEGQIIDASRSVQAHFVRAGVMAFHSDALSGTTTFSSSRGLWLHATNRYLGVKFIINGETHYGWARFNAGAGYAQLTGYAYETIPDKPIPAGVFETAPPESGANSTAGANPGSLGALARGAARR